jgi:hypothetical protein
MDRFRISLIGIGVVLESQLAIGPSDFILGGGLLDAEDFVKISFRFRGHDGRGLKKAWIDLEKKVIRYFE